MNNPDLSTVAAGRMRDEMKRQIEIRIHQSPELTTRLRVAEAAEWLRRGAAGRALEVLEELLAEFERCDRTATEVRGWNADQEKRDREVAAWEAEVKANPFKRVEFRPMTAAEMEALNPRKDPDLADHIATGNPPF